MLVVAIRLASQLNVPGRPDLPYYGMQDFRDAIYYPATAFSEQVNPYDPASLMRRYPVAHAYPFYAPYALLLHWPYTLLSLRAAEIVHLSVNLVLMLVLVSTTMRLCALACSTATIVAVTAAAIIGHPGSMNLITGQCTVYVVLGASLALHWAPTRPHLAALAFVLAAVKPSFGLPLALLMLARRNWRAALEGGVLAGLASVVTGAWIVRMAGGLEPFRQSLRDSFAWFSRSPDVQPTTSVYALDAPSTIARLFQTHMPTTEVLLSVALLAVAMVGVARVSRRGGNDSAIVSAGLSCIAVLVCVHHQTYDALILLWPLTAIAGGRWRLAPGPFGARLAATALVLGAVPALNYLASYSLIVRWQVHGAAWVAVTSVNGLAMLGLFAIAMVSVWHQPGAMDRP